ncbi:MAG: hypothetical protein DCF15_18460 [Phormidesmis priestleyi]|uniref:Uncharacterized protein n=1 Tax=Phormidesmis priestleyi TaxID=268141 RepID=A0A2W4X199_9CYAN|nr:MAG: hypothetical protein DCF15_18460 [Phormidesmis priestleyi]
MPLVIRRRRSQQGKLAQGDSLGRLRHRAPDKLGTVPLKSMERSLPVDSAITPLMKTALLAALGITNKPINCTGFASVDRAIASLIRMALQVIALNPHSAVSSSHSGDRQRLAADRTAA